MKKLTFLLLCLFAGIGLISAQTTRVTGKVISAEDGDPLSGVAVFVKGTSVGIQTDNDGAFTLTNVPAGATHIIFRYIGMRTQEVAIKPTLNIVMEPDAQMLDEVVVSAMGIMRPVRSAGFGQSVVDPSEAIQRAEPDMFRSLAAKIPGVQISAASSTPGSATKILIRGNSSFLGSNDPLYVVDGIPYSNPEVVSGNRLVTAGAYGTGIATLDPNDIETMEVLKGAAAASLYGSRAGNGVILITTKAGSKKARPSQKKNEITLTSSYAIEEVASLPVYQNMYGQGSNFVYSNANGSWGPAFGGELKEIPTWANYLAAYPNMDKTQPYQAYPNNVSGLFRQGNLLDNSINLMSYNDKGNFSTTISYLKQDGFIPYSQFERYSFSVGGSQKLDNGVTVGGTVSYSRTIQDGAPFGAGNYSGSISSFARTLLMPRNIDAVGLPYEDPQGRSLMTFSAATVDNPLWSWKYNNIHTINDRSVANINVGYDFTKWLSAYYQFGLNQYEMDRKNIINIGSAGPSGYAGRGQITNTIYKTQEMESNFNITLKHKLFEDLNVRAVFGHNINQRVTVRTSATGNIMLLPNIYNVNNTQEQTASESHSRRRLWALYTDILFSYKNYAFVNFSMRNDHSSTLPVKNNSYFYPAVTGSFVFSDYFEISPTILNFGKVRASWGRVGNDAGPYYVNGTYGTATPFNDRPLMYMPSDSYDPNLKPEFTTEFEAGTELSFFQNRIGIDFTWYSRSTTDQIAPISLPSSTGSDTYYTNFGELTNKGVEIGFTLVPVNLKNSFKWSLNGTFTKNISKVVSLDKDGQLEQITIPTGSSSEAQPTLKPGYPYGFLRGSVIARDTDGTPLINPSTGAFMQATDLGDLGDPYPEFRTAFTNTFSYKGFTLSALFDARVGGIIISGPASDMLGRGVTKDTEDRLGTRILPGVYADPNTLQPLKDANGNRIQNTVQLSENTLWFAATGTQPTFAMNSVTEFSTFDATVFRLSEITLAYDFPQRWLKKTFIGAANLSLIGRNMWYKAPGFPKYSNYDPGSNTFGAGNVQGIDKESAPSLRRYGVNLKLTF